MPPADRNVAGGICFFVLHVLKAYVQIVIPVIHIFRKCLRHRANYNIFRI